MEMKRRPAVAHLNFQRHRDQVAGRDLAERFRYIFETNLWGSPESRSGLGSAPAATEALARALPDLFRRLGIRRMLDIPCGDFGWLSGLELGLDSYLGADIVPELVKRNTERYAGPGRSFAVLDLTTSALPSADLVLCRDCLVHLSFPRIRQAVANLKRSGSRYLLVTTFPDQESNQDIEDGDWRPLDLCRPPFDFPPPLEIVSEECTEAGGAYADKSLGLWLISGLPEAT
jgi:methyltransferase family protein